MKKVKNISTYCILIILLLLWVPVALDKVLHFNAFRYDILRQPIPIGLAYLAIYSLPVLEVLVVVLLVSAKWRRIGLGLSALLMAVFTGYIAMALLGYWEKLPCGCGSVIHGMSWKQHLWFNLIFLTLSIWGYYLHKNSKEIKENRSLIHSHKIKTS